MWPLRLVARRSPPFASALAVSLAAMLVAVGARMALLGMDRGLGLSVTYIPAMVVATLFAGPVWGWLCLVAAIALNLISPSSFAGRESIALDIMYALSGGVTVMVAASLRENMLRLEAARADREAARQELETSEQRLRLAQDAGDVGLWDWDVVRNDGRWSPVVYKNLGIDPSERPNMETLFSVVHPDDQDSVRRANREGLKTGRFAATEYRAVHPDGSIRWIMSRGEMLRDEAGRIVRAVGVNIDITERRLAFEQVRQSEARFRAMADSAPILMWVSRTDGRREFANRAYVDYLGEGYEAALEFDWRQRLHPDDLQRVLSEQVAGETSRALFVLEARYRRADGQYRWIRSVSQPRLGPTGEFNGFVGVGYDVSDAKRAEADLKRINDLLSERVEAALSERDKAEAALNRAQKLEAVGQLTGGVAHDFNNLLTVVIGALDLMQRYPDDAERRDRMLTAALGAARRGERLTQQLLAFARRQALKPEHVRIDDLLSDSEPLLRRVVGEAVDLTVLPGAPDGVANVDPSQFEAAVMNLVVNARDATAHGGAIRVESIRRRVAAGDVEDLEAGDYICVVVHDTGEGMSAETAARVFEPFFTTKEPGRGTGLGLSQVYGFARQSGGTATLESAAGKGASVRIFLPLVEAAREAPTATVAAPSPDRGPSLRVLLVEDDAAVGEMVAEMLADLGHAVTRVDSAAPALDLLRGSAPIDLLLTDIVMPGGMTGVDLAHAATAVRPQLPVILSSGYTGEALQSADGAPWPLLRKPYSADNLAQLIAATA